MIVTYIFVVTQGWYGSFLIPLLQTWFWIVLVFGLFLFFIFRIIHPFTARRVGSAAGKLARDVGKRMGNEKQIERLEEELKHIRKEMKEQKPHVKNNPGAAQVYAQLTRQEFEIKRRIKELRK